MSVYAGSGRLAALSVSPPTPPSGYCLIYFKADNVLYIKDDTGAETPIGTSSGMTALTGDVTATGPGSAVASVVQVGGKTAAAIASAVNDVQAATASNSASTIVKRDSLGNFAANIITAALNGTASGNVDKTGDTMTGPLNINSASGTALIVDTDVLVVDGALNRVGINKLNPTEALDVVGNGKFTGTISASNISGTNTGDVTVTDSSNIDLSLTGQDITADLTDTAVTPGTYGSSSSSTQITVDQKGRITSATSTSISIPSSQVTDFTEDVQDAIGTILQDTSNIDFTYNDVANQISADLTDTAVTPGTYGSSTKTVSAIVDQKGRVTSLVEQSIAIPSTQITDFVEAAQDAVGSVLVDTSTIDMTYDDVGNTISADVKDGSITDGKIASGIDAAKIGSGIVSNTEFSYLDGVTSSIQTQINSLSGSGITALTGDVTGTGPGSTATTVVSVGGKTSSQIATSVNDTIAATDANTASTIVKRDASGNFSAGTITANLTGNVNGVDPASHASRHLPSGADPIATAAATTILPDQTNAVGTANSLARADHIHNIPSGAVVQIGTSNFAGAAASFALSDHIHAHGNQTNPSLHAVATTSANGFMSSSDKTKLDNSTNLNTPSTLVLRDSSGDFSAGTITATLNGNASTATLATNTLNVSTKTASEVVQSVSDTQAATSLDTASTIVKRDSSKNIHINALLDDISNNVFIDVQNKRFLDVNGKYQLDASETLQTVSLIPNSDAIAQLHKTVSGSSAQFLIQNLATGGASSTDFIANADNGIDSNNYADFGINSSTYSDPSWTINGAGDAYLYNNDGNIAIGTALAAAPVILFSGGTLAANERARVTDSGIVMNTSFKNKVIALTDGATINLDASLGNTFTVTLGGNRTLAAPTNPTDGQKITLRVRQDATGNRTLTYNAVYNFGTDLAGIGLSTSPNAFDYIGMIYNGVSSRWDVVAISRNY